MTHRSQHNYRLGPLYAKTNAYTCPRPWENRVFARAGLLGQALDRNRSPYSSERIRRPRHYQDSCFR